MTAHGYDVFFDYESIPSGDFEQVILGNIRARAHFIIILTPSALERCNDPNDWVRREIETALDERRNIIPVFLEGFDFGSPSISQYLTGKLADLKRYNGQNVPTGFFDEAMEKIRSKFLNVALDGVSHPVSSAIQAIVQQQQLAANEASNVKARDLNAQEWFEKSQKYFEDDKFDDAIWCATEAIILNPNFAEAYRRRSGARLGIGDVKGGFEDADKAIHLKPDDADAYVNRGLARYKNGDTDGAIRDYNEAIRITPNAIAYTNRGIIRYDNGDTDGAITEHNESIRLRVDYPNAYNNRALARYKKGDVDGAMSDLNEAIRIKPNDALYYMNRGIIYHNKGDYYAAVADYQKYFDLGGTNEQVRQDFKKAKENINKR